MWSVSVAKVKALSRGEFTSQFRKERESPMKIEFVIQELGLKVESAITNNPIFEIIKWKCSVTCNLEFTIAD